MTTFFNGFGWNFQGMIFRAKTEFHFFILFLKGQLKKFLKTVKNNLLERVR